MSQTRVTLPITLEHIEIPGDLKPLSLRDFLHDDDDSVEYRFVCDFKQERHGPFDPWELRKEFLTGPPEHAPDDVRELWWQGFVAMAGSPGLFRISKKGFAEWIALLKEAMLRHPREWKKLEARFDPGKVRMLLRPLPVTFDWDGEAPAARIAISGTLPVIIATVQLDALNGAQFRACARTDCVNPPFKLESRRKIFCSPECAHLVAVRRSREPGRKKGGKHGTRKTR
jgi:hypothetical protein